MALQDHGEWLWHVGGERVHRKFPKPPAKLMPISISPRLAVALFCITIFAWGINWSVTQVIVKSVPPLWTTGLRCWIAVFALAPVLLFQRKLVVPPKSDIRIVLSVALLHMTAFSTLAAASQQFLPASTAIVLGYTTPMWVALAAPLVLGEAITRWRAAGVLFSLCGIVVIFNPATFDWNDSDTVFGCGLAILAAICWAANIIVLRVHIWTATPFQLLFWQVLFAAIVLSIVALAVEGLPDIPWSLDLCLLLLYGGLIGTVLAYWAMSIVNRSLPAITTSLGVLATPLVGIGCAALLLGEAVSVSLIAAAVLIVGGVMLGTVVDAMRTPARH